MSWKKGVSCSDERAENDQLNLQLASTLQSFIVSLVSLFSCPAAVSLFWFTLIVAQSGKQATLCYHICLHVIFTHAHSTIGILLKVSWLTLAYKLSSRFLPAQMKTARQLGRQTAEITFK